MKPVKDTIHFRTTVQNISLNIEPKFPPVIKIIKLNRHACRIFFSTNLEIITLQEQTTGTHQHKIPHPSFSPMNDLIKKELGPQLLNVASTIEFVKSDFKSFNAAKWELVKINHPLYRDRFNMIIRNDLTEYTLYGLPVREVYAYLKNNNEVALYILMDVNYNQIEKFIELLGMPWNVTEEDYRIGDFEMLLWDKKQFEVSMLHDFVTGGLQTNSRIVRFCNIPLNELTNDDPW